MSDVITTLLPSFLLFPLLSSSYLSAFYFLLFLLFFMFSFYFIEFDGNSVIHAHSSQIELN